MILPAVLPPPHGAEWPELTADQAGMNWMWLEEAARFATENETPWPYDLQRHLESGYFEPAPFNEILGPIRPRGEPNGLVLRSGSKVLSWGDTRQVDFTFSAAKSYLSMLAGIAVMDGLIRDLDEPVGHTVHDGGFEGPHNGAITWRHLLQNTSEWEGTLFGKSDVIDRNRNLAVEGKGRKGDPRPLQRPGEFWEYNDVRVNRLSLALLRRFRPPASRGVRRTHHAANRRIVGLVLARLPNLQRRCRWQVDRVGIGWHALGRRHADPRRGSGAIGPADASPRRVEWASGCCRKAGSPSHCGRAP